MTEEFKQTPIATAVKRITLCAATTALLTSASLAQAVEVKIGGYIKADAIYDLDEDLLENPETQCHRLLQHCGLDWHPDILNFSNQRRPVSTASLWQVRQPLFKTSIGRWKTYQQHLGPLQKILSH